MTTVDNSGDGKLVVQPVGDVPIYTVTGTLSAPGSASVAGLAIQLVDKNVGGDTVLAETKTDPTGGYTVQARVVPDYLAKFSKSAPDLQVRLMSGDTVTAASIVRYAATSEEQLDIALAAGQGQLASEYEALTAAIGGVYGGTLTDLKENDQQQDITYLANRTGWDARAVVMAALADQLAQSPGPDGAPGTATPPAPFYYALLRAGLPADHDQLHATDPNTVLAIWQRAVKTNLLPGELAGSLEEAIASYRSIAAVTAITAAPAVGSSTLGQLLDTPLNQDRQQQLSFASLLTQYRGDPDTLWARAEQQFGADLTTKLRFDGQLAYLTVNNAPLRDALTAQSALASPVDLVTAGFHDAAAWSTLLLDIDPPPEFAAGTTPEQAKADYAEALAAHVRVSFPTAVMGQLVTAGTLDTGPKGPPAKDVGAFLFANHDAFDIGAEPVAQFVARSGVPATAEVVAAVARLQRVYQLAPNAAVLATLLGAGLDSAYAIARMPADRFVAQYGSALGGADVAALTHSRALTVHAATLHVALSYLTARTAPTLGVTAGAGVVDTTTGLSGELSPGAAGAQATLQDLFGNLDYAACADCRSITSPAAYLVDLLDYLDNPAPSKDAVNPLDALLARRPDIGALPLTCENTTTAEPYIDLVNEILEYYVGAGDSITGYAGHDTDGTVGSAELIAAPQNDDDAMAQAAYTTLQTNVFPAPLPFDRNLALLRAQLAALGCSLYEALRVLRPRDTLDAQPGDDPSWYGWRDVLVERLTLSRHDVAVLTDSTTVTVQELYGCPPADDVAADVSCLQEFSRRTGVDYADIVTIVGTTTVNPHAALLPLLQRLAVPVDALERLHSGALDAAGFAALLPAGLDPVPYGGTALTDVAAWVTANYDALLQLIVIDVAGGRADPTQMWLHHLDPTPVNQALTTVELYRLMRFIRLWRALGLDIATTDDLVQACFVPAADASTDLAELDSGMTTVVLRAGLAYRLLDLLGLDPATELRSAVTCWGPISAPGPESLYAACFLTPTVLARDPAFAPDQQGRLFAQATPPTVLGHRAALCAALGLTDAEFDVLTGAAATPLPGVGLGYDDTTPLTLDRVSDLYRHAWLARALQISVLELLTLAAVTGTDLFVPPLLESQHPLQVGVLDFVTLVRAMTDAGISAVQAIYLLWNVDLSGVSAPPARAGLGLTVQLRSAFAAIDAQFAVPDRPTVDTARSLMALVLGAAAAQRFFGLLVGGFPVAAPLAYDRPDLPPAVLAADGGARLHYDDLGKQLTYDGYLDATTAAGLTSAAGVDAPLVAALGLLVTASQQARQRLLEDYDDAALRLDFAFDGYFTAPSRGDLGALLGGLLPALAQKRKQAQALAVISAATGQDQAFADALLTDPAVLAATSDPGRPAVADLTAADTATPVGVGPNWQGYLLAVQSGTYGLLVQANAGSTVSAQVDGVDAQLTSADGGVTWRNQHPITLDAAAAATFAIATTGLTSPVQLLWKTTGTGWTPVPAGALYAGVQVDAVHSTLVRFLKLTALAGDLNLRAADLKFLATTAGLTVAGSSWTAQLATDGPAAPATYQDVAAVLRGLLSYAALPGGGDGRRAAALTALVGTGDTTTLCSLTGWDAGSLQVVSSRLLGSDLAAAAHLLPGLDRLADAFGLLTTCKLPAATLAAAVSAAPAADHVEAFESAVRSRYSEADWLTVAQGVHDSVRIAQRDALVAHILRRSGPQILTTLGIRATPNRTPTADDLFDYFLVDAGMQPRVQTSRIRLALSSVQLFIERCLRNLEPEVNPADIAGAEWAWRKRYRVWQANREVFLWPENWMDESLRDDQSPIAKTALGQLNTDVSDDSAATAYLGYLDGLAQVAKLEPCGLYLDTGAPGTADDVVHVLARSAGSHRKYYYRRYANGSWTPWADTRLGIEDDPVVPYVWNGRLLAFWVQVHRSSLAGPDTVSQNLPSHYSGEPTLSDAHLSDLTQSVGQHAAAATTERIGVVLCFSEYFNGAWTPVRTSEPGTPAILGNWPTGTFDRSRLEVRPWHSSDPNDEALYVQVLVGPQSNYLLPARWPTMFTVHNTHSAPQQWFAQDGPFSPADPSRARSLTAGTAADGLQANYATGSGGHGYPSGTDITVVAGPGPLRVRSAQNDVDDQWSMPFLAADARHAFYVTSDAPYRWFDEFTGYGLADPGRVLAQQVVHGPPRVVVAKPPLQPGAPAEITPRLGDPVDAQTALSQAVTLRAVLGSTEQTYFGDAAIGAGGSVDRLAVSFEGEKETS